MISIVIISKDEESLDSTLTAVTAQAQALEESAEIVVVDASDGRLDHIWLRHQAEVRWVRFDQPPGVTVSIPHQRNVGVRASGGEIIVFIDAACQPEPEWLARLVVCLRRGEHIATGPVLSLPGRAGRHGVDRGAEQQRYSDLAYYYIRDSGAGNLAFGREVFDAVGGFDERFTYGSDIDFSWRVTDAGYRICCVPGSVIRHDWGTRRRQLRRSYVYGRARVRLYRKHRTRLKHVLRHDFVVVAYPAFLLGLPLTLIFPFYPALLLIPAWRNRSDGAVAVLKNLTFGAGVLMELVAP
jgi:glycosyltransferase involved in cell wall biosynthesis